MKKNILTVVAVFAFSFANAQDAKSFGFAKGDIFGTGTVSSESFSEKGKNTVTKFNTSVGYFLNDNIVLSAGFETESNGNIKKSAPKIGAAYFFNAKNQFSTNISFGLAAGTGTVISDYKYTRMDLSYGVNYFVSSHFAFIADVAVLTYESKTPNGGSAVSTTEIGLNLSKISFGLVYKL
jgi:outer membrane protein